jgi:hypothetical protein
MGEIRVRPRKRGEMPQEMPWRSLFQSKLFKIENALQPKT